MKKYLFIFILLLMSIIFCYGEEQKIFRNKGSLFEYSIEYPSSWRVDDNFPWDVKIVCPTEVSPTQYDSIVEVHFGSVKSIGIEEINDHWLEHNLISDFKLLDKGKSTIDNKEAFFFIYKGKRGYQEQISVKGKRYAFAAEPRKGAPNVYYELTFESKEENFEKDLPVAEKIIHSIKTK